MKYIAEIGQAHEGSIGIAHSYIDALTNIGITAIKFQTHLAYAESSIYEPFRKKFSIKDKTRYDYWKRMEFSFDEWKGLKNHCEENGLEFISSPFSIEAVNLLEKLDVKRYKIGSGEVTNLLMIEKLAKINKPIMISSGMSSYKEIDNAVRLIKNYNGKIDCIFQCVSSYPSDPSSWGLNNIDELKKKYPKIPIGFSDHSGDIYACLAAVTLGVTVLEFHTVFDKQMFGPDSKSSLTINEIKKLIDGANKIKESLDNPINKDNYVSKYSKLKNIFEKSICVNKEMKPGDIISFDDLDSKKPRGQGINIIEYKKVIGKKIKIKKEAFSFLKKEDIE